MIDTLLSLVPHYGPWLLGVVTFLSCLAVPVPASLFMLTAGGFVASGDLSGWQVAATAFSGAVLGDQAGFQIGRAGGAALAGTIARGRARARLMRRASGLLDRRGGSAVFLSRWLFSPLGPYVNLAGGAAAMARGRFTLAGAAGEAVWVGVYVGLGFFFAENVLALGDLLANASGFLAALAVAAGLALWLRARLRQRRADRR